MTTTTYSADAEDKRHGMTAGELKTLIDLVPDDATIVVRVGGRGQIKSARVTVSP